MNLPKITIQLLDPPIPQAVVLPSQNYQALQIPTEDDEVPGVKDYLNIGQRNSNVSAKNNLLKNTVKKNVLRTKRRQRLMN